jgi:hypothetical protein
MRADWIEIKRGDVQPQYSGIHISMNPKGDIVMNRVTYEMMGAPLAFTLLYDRVNNRIGLKPATLSTRNAYPAFKINLAGAKLLRGYRLMREHRIILPQTVEFCDAETDEDGILIIDLRSARVSQRAIGWEMRKKRMEHG